MHMGHICATVSIVWLNKGVLLSYVDKIPNVEGKDDYVTAHEMILPTLIWCEYQCSLFQAPR